MGRGCTAFLPLYAVSAVPGRDDVAVPGRPFAEEPDDRAEMLERMEAPRELQRTSVPPPAAPRPPEVGGRECGYGADPPLPPLPLDALEPGRDEAEVHPPRDPGGFMSGVAGRSITGAASSTTQTSRSPVTSLRARTTSGSSMPTAAYLIPSLIMLSSRSAPRFSSASALM